MPKDNAEDLAKLKAAVTAKPTGAEPKATVPKVAGPLLSEKIAARPVNFTATIGRVYAHDGRVDRHGSVETAPLIVDFGEGQGEEAQLTGGVSRSFYPDKDECEREDGAGNVGSYCDCKHCLEVVRAYIAADRHGICATWKVREEDTEPPRKPYSSFDTAHVDDIENAVKIGAIDDLENAARWEATHQNRKPIIDKLDELAASPEEPEDNDILSAEVVA